MVYLSSVRGRDRNHLVLKYGLFIPLKDLLKFLHVVENIWNKRRKKRRGGQEVANTTGRGPDRSDADQEKVLLISNKNKGLYSE